ncbi:MAG TPA: hypothetical protein VGO53_09755 [Steroidobacteraceae bacterium]|nr:hypothetical protein [Steroidobacteraceae bacterium]
MNAKTLIGCDVDASDGPVGTVIDSYVDQELATLRYLLIDTREWIKGEKTLVAPAAIRHLDPELQKIALSLTRQQVETGPPAESAADARSAREIIGYHIKARDQTFGHLEDMLIETDNWVVRYLLIDTRNWWPGPPVVMGAGWVNALNPGDKTLSIDADAAHIKACPVYDPAGPITREYEAALHSHYKQPGYWESKESSDRYRL